jgi:DNA-binding NarL/FixJ family response regulator
LAFGCPRSIAAVACQVAVGLFVLAPALSVADPGSDESRAKTKHRWASRQARTGVGGGSSPTLGRTAEARATKPSDSKPVTAVLVDRHELIRRALKRSLSAAGIDVAGEAPTGEAGFRLVLDRSPDVVLMELVLHGESGVETIQRLSAAAPASRVLVLTGSEEPHAAVEAILAGACGYMLKDAPPDEVVRAVRATAAGQCVISPEVAGDLLDRIRERDTYATARSEVAASAIRALLTERELAIYKRLASGKSNREIGRDVSLSENTVKNHVGSILDKLQLDNRIQAAVQAVRSGIS